MEFKDFKKKMQDQFTLMSVGQDKLFVTDVSKDVIWDTYLDSFPEGTNNIYKERREFECNSCRQFLRPYANVVAIKNNELVSIWDIEDLESPFKEVAEELSKMVKSAPIRNVFVSKEKKLGVDKNRQVGEDGKVVMWEHFYYELPTKFVDNTSRSVGEIQGFYKASKDVFKRSMEELTLDAGNTFLELIEQGSIYRGEEHKNAVTSFISYKKKYDKVKGDKDNWCWVHSINNPVVRIRNTAVGTLLIDLSEGMELDKAVKKFENVMAPSNYKRPKAIFTKKMVEEAEAKLSELGFSEALNRKVAVLEDITVNNVLWTNRDAKKKMGGSIFDDLKDEIPTNIKKFDKVEEVTIEDFVKNILPKASNVELMMENKHQGNLMTLVAPQDKSSPSMFKWNNNFSWSYNGGLADSMRENVKKAGGNVEGVLRFSIQWNDKGDDRNDLDAHCTEPNGNTIMFNNKRSGTTGNLDVDITNPQRKVAVENITWLDKSKMLEGRYKMVVHNFAHRGGTGGFSAEIEYDGQIYSYEYPHNVKQGEKVIVAEIEFNKRDGIKFIKSLESTTASKEVWGIKTNNFSKVSVVSLSPNYWDEEQTGNKHYFFFMDGCESEMPPKGFYNEYLNDELTKHRKVFEALSSKMKVEEVDSEMSGLGFSSTQRNSIVVKVDGNFSRVMKIKF